MKVFESAMVLSAIAAIASCQDSPNWTNPYRSPSTFEVEPFGEHSSDYYYDQFKPSTHSTAFERKFPYESIGWYPPSDRLHHAHQPSFNEAASKDEKPAAKPAEQQPKKKAEAPPKEGYLVAHRPEAGQRKPKLSRQQEKPETAEILHDKAYEQETVDFSVEPIPHVAGHDTMPGHLTPGHTLTEQTMAPHHKTIAYIPMDTPHTIDAILSKDLDDPNIHYQSYEDFPPDFYKANYYNFYNDIVKDMLPHESIEDYYPHSVYRPLKIHSYADNGFYYYDEHPQTDFRHASAHSYGPDYHSIRDQDPYFFHNDIGMYGNMMYPVDDASRSDRDDNMIHSSGQAQDPNWMPNFKSFGGMAKKAAGAVGGLFKGGSKTMRSMGKTAGSIASKVGSSGQHFVQGMTGQGTGTGMSTRAGQLFGGMMGTGGGATGSMAGMAGQALGGAFGLPGGQDAGMAAQMGQMGGAMFGMGGGQQYAGMSRQQIAGQGMQQFGGQIGQQMGQYLGQGIQQMGGRMQQQMPMQQQMMDQQQMQMPQQQMMDQQQMQMPQQQMQMPQQQMPQQYGGMSQQQYYGL